MSADELPEIFAAAAADPLRPYVNTIAVDEDAHLVLPAGHSNGYGNHSCDPNVWWVDEYALAARRYIPAGEELTNDYATSTGLESFTMWCSCGSPLCRRVITGNDWRIPWLQLRYGEHWAPLLSARIRALTARCAPAAPDSPRHFAGSRRNRATARPTRAVSRARE